MKKYIPKNIILYSTADWDNPFWTNKQHMAVHLAKKGFKVLYIESLGLRTPTVKAQDLGRIFKRIFSFFKGSREVQKNIYVYSPLAIPLHRYSIVRFLNKFLLQLILTYLRVKLGMRKHIGWTYNPAIYELIATQNPELIIYHSVDDLSAAPGMDKDSLLQTEKNLLSKADLVFCTSKKIYHHCKKYSGERTHYYPNVVDFEHFSSARNNLHCPKDLEKIPQPRIGFIGALSEYKVDFPLIENAAKKHPEWSFIMIGKIGEGQPNTTTSALELPNVHHLGPKSYSKLPSYLSNFDVCTIPCPVNDYTQSMFPMKFFEYMAAGKPIVARDIDSLKDFTEFHYSYSTQQEFCDSLTKSIQEGEPSPKKSELLAQKYTWEARLQSMLQLIEEAS